MVTLPSLQGLEIEDYGYQLGRAWGIGQKGKNNGALFIIAPAEHQLRIEVGYGLEPVLTDALSSVILQTAVLPKFRSGDVSGGVVAGTDAIIQQLGLDPQTAEANAKAAQVEAAQAEQRPVGPRHTIPVIFIVLIVFFVIRMISGRARRRALGAAVPVHGRRRRLWRPRRGGFGGGGGSQRWRRLVRRRRLIGELVDVV